MKIGNPFHALKERFAEHRRERDVEAVQTVLDDLDRYDRQRDRDVYVSVYNGLNEPEICSPEYSQSHIRCDSTLRK